MLYNYRAKLIRVIDGDTYVFQVQLGFGISNKITVRLKDYNTPELNTEEGRKVRFLVSEIFSKANEIIIKTTKTSKYKIHDKKGKYGRYLTDVFIDGKNLKEVAGWPDQDYP